MSPQHMSAMDDDRRSDYGHHQPGHPKAERARAKESASRSAVVAKGPVYPPKNRYRAHPADRAATPGDAGAHGHDDGGLCRKLLPRDRQERRGCRARDVDRRNRSWNKQVRVGVVVVEDEG